MISRRISALALAIGLGLTGAVVTTSVAIAGDKPPDFSKLKKIKEPNPCKNAQGVTDDTIKVGLITIQSGPSGSTWSQPWSRA